MVEKGLKALGLVSVLLFSPSGWSLPENRSVPGGVAVIALPDSVVAAYAQDRRVLISAGHAVVGIALDASLGKQRLRLLDHKGNESTLEYLVSARTYPEQRLEISDKARAEPDQNAIDRILRDQKVIKEGFATWTPSAEVEVDLVWPVQAVVSSEFGLRRYINGIARSPHSGIDIAATEGSQVIAASSGKIIIAEEFFLNGNSVMIDHGQGLKTLYCHLQLTQVEAGQRVAVGQAIGKVGKTGRVTAAHLHWAVSLNGVPIDPRLLLPKQVSVLQPQ